MRKRIILGLVMVGMAVYPVSMAGAQTGTRITYGDTVSGEIAETVPCVTYWFEGTEGDQVTLTLTRTSGNLDAMLSVYQETDPEPVAFNDDRPDGSLDPQIEFALPATDWYTVTACHLEYSGMRPTTGTFDLTVTGTPSETADAPANSLTEGILGDTTPTPPCDVSASGHAGHTPATAAPTDGAFTAYGGVLSGHLPGGDVSLTYALPITAGTETTLDWQRTAGDLAPSIRVTGPDGILIAQAAVPDSISRLQLAFTAPATGTAIITVSSPTSGTFSLVAQ